MGMGEARKTIVTAVLMFEMNVDDAIHKTESIATSLRT